jgi:hypothetical protein
MNRCQHCGRFLPASFAASKVTWCAPICLERYIRSHNLRQRALPLGKQ